MSAAAEHHRPEAVVIPSSAGALADEITELCSYIYAATYRLLVLIREFDELEGWAGPGLCSCAHWLNFRCGIGMNAAREKVRVAHALKRLPNISQGFERGELSYSKVRAMTRIANEQNEDFLLRIARHGTACHMEKLVQKYRRARRLQDVEHSNRRHRERYLEYHHDEDGCLVITGRLPAEQGALLVKALEKAVDAGVSAETPSVDESEPHLEDEADPVRAPLGARRADALAEVAETYLNVEHTPAATADRFQVVLHVSAETPLPDCDGESHLEDGPHVSAETSRRIQCDCSTILVTDDQHGEPLSIGRKSRRIPPAIRRALRYRDKGCRFPGCTRTRVVDGHHIRHWADGGETRLDNLVQLCRFHHRLVHEGGYGCERTADGEVVFMTVDLRTLPDSAAIEPAGMTATEHIDRYLAGQRIDADTCVPQYYAGDRMDWHLAVAALFPSPGR